MASLNECVLFKHRWTQGVGEARVPGLSNLKSITQALFKSRFLEFSEQQVIICLSFFFPPYVYSIFQSDVGSDFTTGIKNATKLGLF